MNILQKKNRKVENYFKFIKNWDNTLKKDLIVKLTESIDHELKDKNVVYIFDRVFPILLGRRWPH